MSRAWIVILIASAIIYCLKAAAPMLLGDRQLPTWLSTLTMLMPAALLAALVAVSTLAAGKHLQLDARAVGLGAAAIALWRKQGFIVVVVVAALATAATRALS